MRLLNARTHRLETYPDHASRPRYAILSHTWAEEEVTFQDVEAASPPTHMLGYQKVLGTCHQALERGLDYVWVDTCCIDKTSSTELSIAINSMYQWYQDAEICLAYLSDVPFAPHDEQRQKKTFATSRWFKRGWTLQELLGPTYIIFFSVTWDELGDRTSLSPSIGTATRIDAKFLGYNGRKYLAEASIAEKMDWAATRRTSVIEDKAYCLLGIFGINMPLLYGEGPNAFLRLQEELIRRSDDQSIFAWRWTNDDSIIQEDQNFNGQGVLAKSPASFFGCSWIEYRGRNSHREPFSLINTGISIKAPCSVDLMQSGRYYRKMMLRCGPKDDPTSVLTIPISRIQDKGEFFLRQGPPTTTPYSTCMRWKPKLITLSVQRDDRLSERRWSPRNTPVWVKTIPPGFYFTDFHPPAKWSQARVVQVPAPGRFADKPFCRIKHRDSGTELTLVLINRWRFESLAASMWTQPVTRVKIILLTSADDPETCEAGTSHYTWPGGKILMRVKTSYEPTTEGPLLTLSIEERDAKRKNWILVQDTLEQTGASLVDIINTFNGRLAKGGLELREFGLVMALLSLAAAAEAGNPRRYALWREVPLTAPIYFHLAMICLLVFGITVERLFSPAPWQRQQTFMPSPAREWRRRRGGLRPLLLLAALMVLDDFFSPYFHCAWVILLLIFWALMSFLFQDRHGIFQRPFWLLPLLGYFLFHSISMLCLGGGFSCHLLEL